LKDGFQGKPCSIVGLDNLNAYYDVSLKEYRLQPIKESTLNSNLSTFNFIKGDLADKALIDSLFADTGKKIVRTENEIRFSQIGETLVPYQLSSGEKQMLAILLTVLVEDNRPYVLFMDEPEVSLHVEWQQRLIDLIRDLNPNAQIILTTHSPAVIMNGWMDRVTEVSDVIVDK
jgi:ABC-type multidrug transport system ATPase subunit